MKKIGLLAIILLTFVGYAHANIEISTPGTNIGIGTNSVQNALSIAGGWAIGGASYTNTTAPSNGAIIQGNVGIGKTSPAQALDVQGTVKSTYLTSTDIIDNGTNVGIGSPSPISLLDVGGSIRMSQTMSTATTLDCTVVPASDGSLCSSQGTITTTGSISSSANTTTLTVASAAGWSVGMGIDITGAAAAGADLITYVTAISGTTFTVNTAASTTVSGAVINHDESRALQDAVQSGLNVHLRTGTYNVTSAVKFNQPIIFEGDGAAEQVGGALTVGVTPSIIMNRGTTNNILDLFTNNTANFVTVNRISIQQASGITPTAGFAFIAGQDTASQHFITFTNSSIISTYGGISIGNGATEGRVIHAFFDHLYIRYSGSDANSFGVYENNKIGFGDIWWDQIDVAGLATSGDDLRITQADTQSFSHFKCNTANYGVVIDDSHGSIENLRFNDLSCETATGVGLGAACFNVSSTGTNTVSDLNINGAECNIPASRNCIAISSKTVNTIISNVTAVGGSQAILLQTSAGNVSVNHVTCSGLTDCVSMPSATPTNNVSLTDINCSSSVTTCIADQNNPHTVFSSSIRNGAVNVGIGTSAPPVMLDVWGTVGPIAVFAGGGNMGVGSVNPGTQLDVTGTIRASTLSGNSAGTLICEKADGSLGTCTTSITGVVCASCN